MHAARLRNRTPFRARALGLERRLKSRQPRASKGRALLPVRSGSLTDEPLKEHTSDGGRLRRCVSCLSGHRSARARRTCVTACYSNKELVELACRDG
jgi:hypothetical protein